MERPGLMDRHTKAFTHAQTEAWRQPFIIQWVRYFNGYAYAYGLKETRF